MVSENCSHEEIWWRMRDRAVSSCNCYTSIMVSKNFTTLTTSSKNDLQIIFLSYILLNFVTPISTSWKFRILTYNLSWNIYISSLYTVWSHNIVTLTISLNLLYWKWNYYLNKDFASNTHVNEESIELFFFASLVEKKMKHRFVIWARFSN